MVRHPIYIKKHHQICTRLSTFRNQHFAVQVQWWWCPLARSAIVHKTGTFVVSPKKHLQNGSHDKS